MIEVALADAAGDGFRLDLDFSAPASGITALLGPSASGKTSILRAVAGLDRRPGVIRFDGETWQDRHSFSPAHRRRIGYVMQAHALLPHLSVAGNLDYAARRNPAGPFDREDIIARTGISGLLERKPHRLSGGEGQRAAIARALLGQPRLLLLDEPLSGVDSEGRAALLAALAGLFDAISIPVIYVSHDHGEVAALTRRIISLRAGQIESITLAE